MRTRTAVRLRARSGSRATWSPRSGRASRTPRYAWNSSPSAPGLRPSRKALGPSMAMFIGRVAPVHPPISMTGQTMSEKILARASHAESVRPGQIVDGDVDLLYMHEMLALALLPFNEIGTMKVWDPEKIVVTLDHWVPPPTPEIAKMHQSIRDFYRKQGIRRFHDVGHHGIVHQLIAGRGYAHPWDLVIGSDSHTNMVGAVGAFAAGGGGGRTPPGVGQGRTRAPVAGKQT